MIEKLAGFWSKCRTPAIVGAVCLAVGASVGFFAHPPKTQTITKTEIQTVDKIVEKQVAVHDKSVTTTTTDKKANGEVVTTTVVKADVTSDTEKKSETESKTVEKDSSTTKTAQADYSIGAMAKFSFSNLLKPTYEVSAGRRVLGGVWAEAGYDLGAQAIDLGVRIEL